MQATAQDTAHASSSAQFNNGNTRPNRTYVGRINLASGGGPGTPLRIPPAFLGDVLDLECYLSPSFTQVASETTAPAFNDVTGPWSFMPTFNLQVAGVDDPVQGVSGFDLYLFELMKTRSFSTTGTSQLPPKNTTTSPVTTTENWFVPIEVPIAYSYSWPRAMLPLGNQQLVAMLNPTFNAATSILTLNTGSTVNWGADSYVDVYLRSFSVPANPQALPSSVGREIHQLLYLPTPLTSSGKVLVNVPTGQGIRYLRMAQYVVNDGVIDTSNGMGLSTLQLIRQTNDIQQTWTYNGIREDNAKDYLQPLPGGAWCFDLTTAFPRDVIDASALSYLQVQLNFTGSQPTQPAEVHTVLEALLTQ